MSFFSRLDKNTITGFVVMAGVIILNQLGVAFGDKSIVAYSIIGYFVGVAGMALLGRIIKSFSPARLRPEAKLKLFKSLQALDFFHVNHSGAIGLDVSRRRIAVLDSVFRPVSVFDYDSVFDCSIIMKNNTIGLLFDMDDLDIPDVFTPMSEGDAEGWLRILRRLEQRALDAQENPRHYPE